MIYRYEITRGDLMYATLFMYHQSKDWRKYCRFHRAFIWLTGAMCSLIIFELVSHRNPIVAISLATVILAIFLWLSTRDGIGQMKKDISGENYRSDLGPMELIIREAGIDLRHRFFSYQVDWGGVLKLDQSSEHIYVFTAPLSAITIPKRCFCTPNQAAIFFEELKQNINRAIPTVT